ncbi:hypothetical protein HKT18_11515 [Flavobacterium sp. IMCC34852]|uniref:Uncharacterized protein n=1 Tax=Flavobacterium rivulicola TaxID=2732161 RepID=A0A7Y3RAD1_9FLAO|nr:hypothetical protein [Flavobacterium sp. IMCC34852]NNT72845.1 hypothetical protein [Flavobacterium sp. IMCC34852]
MKNNFKYLSVAFLSIASLFVGCQDDDYSMGDLTAPTGLAIQTEVVGQDASNPNGDGSGKVNITVSANDAMSFKIGYNEVTDLMAPVEFSSVPSTIQNSISTGTIQKKFTSLGLHTYRITVVAYGRGGTSTTATADVEVVSNFAPDPSIVTYLTNDSSKAWKVDKSVPGHFGVGPWTGAVSPIWWSAAIDEKVLCCNCFYTSTFTFTRVTSSNSFTIQAATPDGAFTKTGSLASIPGIPGSGDEGCYSYGGGTTPFSFIPSSSGIASDTPSTQTSIMLSGSTTFIGYGSLQKEYEIMVITPTYMYLRVQGTETGNAWYLKLIPAL